MTTQRLTLRRSLRLPVSLGRRLPALTADVSRGGFQAELPQVFLPGSKVHGFFLVGDAEVAFRGTVAWAEAGNPQLSLYSRIGVAFDALPEALAQLLSAQDRRPKKLKARAKK
ncbi:MAG: PilZ domain-containing protein [Archangium sp.]|nr:PilZ domain-containing protein [Archangium sp.]